MKTLRLIVGIASIISGVVTILFASLFLLDKIDNLGYAMMGMLACLICSSVNCALLAINAKKKN